MALELLWFVVLTLLAWSRLVDYYLTRSSMEFFKHPNNRVFFCEELLQRLFLCGCRFTFILFYSEVIRKQSCFHSLLYWYKLQLSWSQNSKLFIKMLLSTWRKVLAVRIYARARVFSVCTDYLSHCAWQDGYSMAITLHRMQQALYCLL